METKESCFKNFNGTKVILSKKIRDFRATLHASILTCRDYKINTKVLKILTFLFMLFFGVFKL